MKNPTPLSALGSIMIANDVKLGWCVLILANLMWITKYYTSKNTDGVKLHAFYLANSMVAVIKYII